jgi:DNA-binding NtrC family response regulator
MQDPQPRSHSRHPLSSIDCVVLTSFETEFAFLKSIFRFAGIRMHHAENLEQADFLLIATGATVLLSDLAVVDCTWRSALERLNDYHPLVPLLLIADPVDQPFVQDAYTRGACGVLWKPIQFDAGVRLIRVAHEASRERAVLREELLSARPDAAGASLVAPGDRRSRR